MSVDLIFIPQGFSKTFAEDTELRDKVSPFRETIVQFSQYIKKI